MKIINKKDIILISSILILAAVFFLWQHLATLNYSELYATIRLEGQIIKTVSLNYDTEFSLDQRPNVRFQVENRQVAFIMADCPCQVCVNVGFISRVGQTAACLPNGLIMYIQGQHPYEETLDIII